MKTVFRTISLLLALCFTLSLIACSGSVSGPQSNTPAPSQSPGAASQTPGSSSPGAPIASPEPGVTELANGITLTTLPWYKATIDVYTSKDTGFKKKTPPGTVIIGNSGGITNVWPLNNQNEYSWSFSIYESLIGRNWVTGEYEPLIATNWEFDNEGALHFYLRDDVKFHDGSMLTADDVFYTFKLNAASVQSVVYDLCNKIDYEKSYSNNPYHVAFVLKEPAASILASIASSYLGIISKSFDESVGPDYDYLSADAGSGPYMCVDTVTGSSQTFKRFEDYWGPKPDVETVIYKLYKDYTPMFIDFINGDLDICFNNNFDSVTRFLNGEVSDAMLYYIPINRGIGLYLCSQEGEPFSDRRLRQALAYCIDYNAIGMGIYGGEKMSTLPTSIFLKGVEHAINLGPHEYNPQKAAALLAEAGYDTKNRLSVLCITSDNVNNRAAAEIVQAYAAEIGIDIEVQSLSSSAVGPMRLSPTKVMDILCHPIDSVSLHPTDVYDQTFTFNKKPGEYPYTTGINDETYSRLYQEANRTMDYEKADALYKEIQELVHEECWIIPLVVGTSNVACRSYLQNTQFLSGYNCRFKDWKLLQ